MTEREQYGRRTGPEGVTFSHGDGPAAELAVAIALHSLNEGLQGCHPGARCRIGTPEATPK
ncbi:hypothetical protein AB0N07_10985 [Streptomyces sp. NPDC051172]|uniref:hypothetical protein n=1 Tax=Streptomyces sp. NPDC051172 TaxID=3155796 RepID=UPI003429A49E